MPDKSNQFVFPSCPVNRPQVKRLNTSASQANAIVELHSDFARLERRLKRFADHYNAVWLCRNHQARPRVKSLAELRAERDSIERQMVRVLCALEGLIRGYPDL